MDYVIDYLKSVRSNIESIKNTQQYTNKMLTVAIKLLCRPDVSIKTYVDEDTNDTLFYVATENDSYPIETTEYGAVYAAIQLIVDEYEDSEEDD